MRNGASLVSPTPPCAVTLMSALSVYDDVRSARALVVSAEVEARSNPVPVIDVTCVQLAPPSVLRLTSKDCVLGYVLCQLMVRAEYVDPDGTPHASPPFGLTTRTVAAPDGVDDPVLDVDDPVPDVADDAAIV